VQPKTVSSFLCLSGFETIDGVCVTARIRYGLYMNSKLVCWFAFSTKETRIVSALYVQVFDQLLRYIEGSNTRGKG
jgi:hypothetical protein